MRTPGDRPPLVYRGLMRLASALAPEAAGARWSRELEDLWVLTERGELPLEARGEMAALCRQALAEAFSARGRREWLADAWRRPWVVLSALALALVTLSWASAGFASTREVADHFLRVRFDGPPMPKLVWNEHAQLTVIGYTIPFLFANVASLFLIAVRKPALAGGGWGYWLFFIAKLMAVPALITAGWVELTEAARAWATYEPVRILGAGLLLWCLYIAAFTRGLLWCVTDQQMRCPVCGKRLAMPVSLGSRASLFDPPVTEFLCDDGHGRLSVSETPDGEVEEWRDLDSSWRDLFHTHSH
jgi:hypothetical protein